MIDDFQNFVAFLTSDFKKPTCFAFIFEMSEMQQNEEDFQNDDKSSEDEVAEIPTVNRFLR